jgi:cyclopropane-fatty-acyl-phospholipid synthase
MGIFTGTLMRLAESGVLPDGMLRLGMRRLLESRLASLPLHDPDALRRHISSVLQEMEVSPLAICTGEANEQHYELPAAYFDLVLGAYKKYSSCYWDALTPSLDQAEANALSLTCEHACLENGQRILELGCGWGSLTLWMAQHYPAATITAVSNSVSQKNWIDRQLSERNLTNVTVITADMNHFTPQDRFDRVVSVEMCEHMRNWSMLFGRISDWLVPGGKFFMHVFCHRSAPYFFDDGSSTADDDWMSRYFFSGGLMPSYDLPGHFQGRLSLEQRWLWSGAHYAETLRAWLARHDANREQVLALFEPVYGAQALTWFLRWRLFYLACEELFRFNNGSEWFVGHYRFADRGRYVG